MQTQNKIVSVIVPILSVLLAFVIGSIIIAALGASPAEAGKNLLKGALGSRGNIGTMLVKATPLIFTSLCGCFAYRCGVINLGGEGQFIAGAVAAVWVALCWGIEGPLACVLALVVGAVVGGIWGAIPGILKIRRGLNEIIVSIMLNYVALLFMGWTYTELLRDGSVPQTFAVPDLSKLGRMFQGMRVTWGFLIAVVLAFVIYYYLFNTSSGFQLRAVGLNDTAARFQGFPVKRLVLFSFIASGAIAGLGGASELMGTQYRLMSGFGSGFGFDGVAIALIAQLNPIVCVIVSIFFAILRTGATTMQAGSGVPTSVIDIIQALVIVFAVAGSALVKLPSARQLMLKLSKKTGKEG